MESGNDPNQIDFGETTPNKKPSAEWLGGDSALGLWFLLIHLGIGD